MTVSVANAPVSYGAFELTVGTDQFIAPASRVLDEVAAAGYVGIDLGPLGYLAPSGRLADELAGRGLGLAGGYIDLPFQDPSTLDVALPQLDMLLEVFDGAAARLPGPRPRPTLAAARRSIPLDQAGWQQFALGLALVVNRCRERGFEPTFHHHAASLIETPAEIRQLLTLSDVALCLDTGHLLVGGGEPVAAILEWADRINQVHLKDASRSVIGEIAASNAPTAEIWKRSAFRPLGKGDLDVDGVLAALRKIGYEGWLVVEQDVLINDAAGLEGAAADQRANRRFLADRGW